MSIHAVKTWGPTTSTVGSRDVAWVWLKFPTVPNTSPAYPARGASSRHTHSHLKDPITTPPLAAWTARGNFATRAASLNRTVDQAPCHRMDNQHPGSDPGDYQ